MHLTDMPEAGLIEKKGSSDHGGAVIRSSLYSPGCQIQAHPRRGSFLVAQAKSDLTQLSDIAQRQPQVGFVAFAPNLSTDKGSATEVSHFPFRFPRRVAREIGI
jgi:hypothetical protein